jgi:hypothetical protein
MKPKRTASLRQQENCCTVGVRSLLDYNRLRRPDARLKTPPQRDSRDSTP